MSPDDPENPETPDSSEPTGPAAGPPPAPPISATPAPLTDAVPAAAADDAAVMTEPPKSRADLQAELRKSKKKDRKRKHRWRRRILYACAALIVLIAAGAGGIYVYANYRFDQIKKVHSKHLVAQPADPLKPFNLLLVGSDSRAFVDNSTQVRAFGDEADAGGQRSDVTMVARFDPANKTVTVLSIPRDLWVDIPGNTPNISGMNRINAAYNSGPDLLVQTIEQVLGIPINHYASVGFDGFSGMVNALGGITMDFPTAVKDQYTGLDVTQTGCQVVNGTTALQLVRSRHLYYMNSQRLLGVRRPVRLQSHPAPGRLLPRGPGQDQLVHHQPVGHQQLHRGRGGQRHHRRHPDPGRPPPHRRVLPRPALVAPHHRDPADDGVRDRRRGRRPPGGAALRAEHDQRVQRHRDDARHHDHDDRSQGDEGEEQGIHDDDHDGSPQCPTATCR